MVDINQYFKDQGYNLLKPIVINSEYDGITKVWCKSIDGVNVFEYGITEEEAEQKLIEAIIRQVVRHREYQGSEVKGKIDAKIKFINEHLGD